MSFLAPLFLAGAAAIALPFIFHLIRRSSREKIVFSSLMFLEPSPPRLTKKSRLEHLLLLLLRCAVLCLLAFAFARPFLARPMAPAAAAEQSSRVVIMVDTSASMRREDLWAQAKDRAVQAVRDLKPSDAFAVYLFDRQVRSLLSFTEAGQLTGSDRAAAVGSRLDAVNPGWAGTHLGNALLQGAEHLLEELNRDSKEQGNASSRLIVISDLQSGAKLDGIQGFEWPNRMQVQFETVKGKDVSNAGIQVLEESRNAFTATTNSAIRLRVSNAAGSKVEQFEVQWRKDALEPLGEKVSVYVPAGQSRIVAAPAKPEGANTLALSGDKVDFDNIAYTASAKQRDITIGYFGNESAGDPQQMRYYIHRAFEQTNLATRVLAFSNNFPAAENLSLLVLGAPANPEVIELGKKLLREGRTIVIPLRDASTANTISSLTGVLVSAPEAQPKGFGMFGRIDFQHPLFSPFSDARYSDFTKIHFWKFRGLDLANITNANVIASFDTGQPLLAEIPVEKGRLLVLASTWTPADSQLALSSKFVPLLFGILEQSANLRQFGIHHLVGEVLTLPEDVKEISLPNGEKKAIEAPGRFASTEFPGVYAAGESQFAVNVDPSESRISPVQTEDLRNLGVPLGASQDVVAQQKTEERQRHLLASETESRQKMWRNFILIAVALLLLESWLSGRMSRRVSAPIAA